MLWVYLCESSPRSRGLVLALVGVAATWYGFESISPFGSGVHRSGQRVKRYQPCAEGTSRPIGDGEGGPSTSPQEQSGIRVSLSLFGSVGSGFLGQCVIGSVFLSPGLPSPSVLACCFVALFSSVNWFCSFFVFVRCRFRVWSALSPPVKASYHHRDGSEGLYREIASTRSADDLTVSVVLCVFFPRVARHLPPWLSFFSPVFPIIFDAELWGSVCHTFPDIEEEMIYSVLNSVRAFSVSWFAALVEPFLGYSDMVLCFLIVTCADTLFRWCTMDWS